MFQSMQRRKDRKFVCVVCHQKQSVVRIFGVSDRASDIRQMVQKYNMAAATAQQESSDKQEEGNDDEQEEEEQEQEQEMEQEVTEDKWAKFLVEDDAEDGDGDDGAGDGTGGIAGRLVEAAVQREQRAPQATVTRRHKAGVSREPARKTKDWRRQRARPYAAATASKRQTEHEEEEIEDISDPEDDDFERPPSSSASGAASATPAAAASKWARFL